MSAPKKIRNLRICLMRDAGMTYDEIAEKMGINRIVVFNIYKRERPRLPDTLDEEKIAQAIQEYVNY